ncbi:MAG TPA: hypothetical protein VGO47_05285, partial [Chlamydiales bacterium]|nr:hypothetical protein [Chlamydiales bacterium]
VSIFNFGEQNNAHTSLDEFEYLLLPQVAMLLPNDLGRVEVVSCANTGSAEANLMFVLFCYLHCLTAK